jgi:hypothetical protein
VRSRQRGARGEGGGQQQQKGRRWRSVCCRSPLVSLFSSYPRLPSYTCTEHYYTCACCSACAAWPSACGAGAGSGAAAAAPAEAAP